MRIIEIIRFFEFILDGVFISYAMVLVFSYITLGIVSALSLRHYLKKNSFVDYRIILHSPLAPSVSILVPSFNEEVTIVESIRSLMGVYYNDFEIVVVNDGSTDGTLEVLLEAFNMEKVDFAVNEEIPVQRIRGIYKSKDEDFKNFIVVDKENGGKADALNAGINVAQKDLFMAIDADSIIEPDALLKLVKPFIERSDKRVIAAGGVVRIVNSCTLENGRITDIRLPKNLLARMQVLEYTRAFLMGRMAWAKLNGLIIISGALGMFDREIVIQSGGYSTSTIGEDMELIVRIRRLMSENREKYKIEYVPDPLCWTEVPSSLKVFGRQRSRWTRGTIETLFSHSRIFFSPRYGAMGMLGYPFWFFFEWLAPLIEVFGIIYLVILAVTGNVSWYFIAMTFLFVYTFALFFSSWAILYEELTFHRYEKKSDILRLWIAALLEPFIFHPLNLLFAVVGNLDYLRGSHNWGSMERVGFDKGKKVRVKSKPVKLSSSKIENT